MKRPYKFSARSRAAMLAAIQKISNPRSYYGTRYPFTWNVKIPYVSNVESARVLNPFHYDGGQFNPSWDDDWRAEMDSDWSGEVIVDQMRMQIDDWTSYDCDDARQFEFEFVGRSGGWLALRSAHGSVMAGVEIDDMAELSTADLRQLYRALVTMDHDFSRDSVRNEFLAAVAFQRAQWESDRREADIGIARELEAARPDMYASV